MASVRNRRPGGGAGRAKADRPIEALARRHTDIAVGTLVEVCGDRDAAPAARVAAAIALLDRAWGRPRQPLEHSGETSVRFVIRAPAAPPTAEEWLARYAPKPSEPA